MLDAFVGEPVHEAGDVPESPWARAALEDGMGADEGYGSAPPL